MTQAFESMLGPKLLSKNGPVNTAEALKGKLVALYFSAHWCPPCRQFTPEFARVYESLTNGANGKPFAVVFVSHDQDEEAFNEYFGEQPWYAIPFDAEEIRNSLGETFGIRGIPALLILNEEGKLITKDARSDVMKQKEAAYDSWQQKNAPAQSA